MEKYHKFNNHHIKFSDPLYSILHYANEILDFNNVDGNKEVDRKFMQFVGTEWARNKNNDVWVNYALKTIKKCSDSNIFISDVRFKNEAEMLKSNGFTLIKINRDNLDKNKTHISENELNDNDGWDYIIDNNDTERNLYSEIDNILHNIYGNINH